ncbi:MAG: UDP-2,3-diacylglucosamine diphosphatase LpxI [Candidatus Omnitrophica bacterium]|nr:UDP-2,3-diacylglucosamine diphosphatase LpxI [Candidatus Omnitrophota bacterium]
MIASSEKPKIGVIAGFGDFPREVCERAKKKGYEISLCGVEGEASPDLETLADKTVWVRLGEIGKLLHFFNRENVNKVILAGKIHKVGILSGKVVPDLDAIKMLASVRSFKDDSLLNAFCAYIEKRGVKIIDSTEFLKDALLDSGVLTREKPSSTEQEDIDFGFRMAKEIAGLDIGQTVVVKNKSVIAVESVEGTDQAILRGGRLAEKGAVVVKVAKPNQDMRFDVPTIGPSTVETCQTANISVLAFEAGKTIVLHPEKVIRFANENKIAIVAYTPK